MIIYSYSEEKELHTLIFKITPTLVLRLSSDRNVMTYYKQHRAGRDTVETLKETGV